MNKVSALLMPAGCCFLALACTASKMSYHADQALIARKGAPVAVLADINLIDDAVEDTLLVDVARDKSYGGLILNHFEERLKEKKYNVGNLALTSVGLLVDRTRIYRLSSTAIDNEGTLPFIRAPFYLNEAIRDDSSIVSGLAETYRTLLTIPVETLSSRRFFPVTDSLGARFQGETLICLILGGYIVPENARIRERPAAVPYGRGLESEAKVTQISLTMYILDAKEGSVLWSDQAVSIGGNVNTNKLLHLADELIEGLPLL